MMIVFWCWFRDDDGGGGGNKSMQKKRRNIPLMNQFSINILIIIRSYSNNKNILIDFYERRKLKAIRICGERLETESPDTILFLFASGKED